MRTATLLPVFLLVCCMRPVDALSQTPGRNVLDGVYSEEQSARGQVLYERACGTCHGNALEGISAPALIGDRFIERWRESPLDLLHDFLMDSMPPRRGAAESGMSEDEYIDILAYLLKFIGYPVGGDDLTPAAVNEVMLVGLNGPQPVPDGALVMTLGCLDQTADGVWTLTRAAEPVRTRTSDLTPREREAASRMRLGELVFRLADLGAVPNFVPEMLRPGNKLQAKGFLVRQPNQERISLSALETLEIFCE